MIYIFKIYFTYGCPRPRMRSLGGHMKYIISIVLISLNLHAESTINFDCKVDYSNGDVNLFYTHDDGQEFDHYVGREAFLDPYKVRNECKQLLNEISATPTADWVALGCDTNNYSALKEYETEELFPISAFGKSLLNLKTDTIQFLPLNPSNKYFKEEFDNDCNFF